MTRNRILSTLGILAGLGLILALAAPPVRAATQYWDAVSGKTGLTGSGNGDWGTSNVWVANANSSTTPGLWTQNNSAVFDCAGTSSVTVNSAISAGNVYLADGNQTSGSSITVNFSGSSTLTGASGDFLGVGWTTGGASNTATAVLNMSGGTISCAKMSVGRFGTTGILNVSGGLLSDAGIIYLGNGTYNASSTVAPSGTVSVTGGTMTAGNTTEVGQGSIAGHIGSGLLSVGGSGLYQTTTLYVGDGSYMNASVNLLSGGTLSASSVTEGALLTSTTGTFNFMGGMLLATANTTSFMTGIDNAYVQNGGAIINDGGFAITISQPLQHFSGATTDSLTKLGGGTLTLSGSNNYAGGTIIQSGTLIAGNNSALGSPTGPLTVNGSLFDLSGHTVAVGSLAGSAGTVTSSVANGTLVLAPTSPATYSGTIAGQAGLTLNAPGTVFALGGANVNSGLTTVLNGTLQLASPAGLNSNGPVLVNGGALDLAGYTATAGSVTLAAGTIIDSVGGGTLTAPAYTVQSGTVSAVLGGGGSGPLTMTGPGNALLTAANSYGGPTTITAGTLTLGASGTLGSGNLTINSGGVLDVMAHGPAGYTFAAGVLTAGHTGSSATDINGTLNANNAMLTQSASNSTMTISGGLALSSGTDAFYPGDVIAVGGALTLGGTDYIAPLAQMGTGTYTLFTYNGSLTGGTADLAIGGGFVSNRQNYHFTASSGIVALIIGGAPANLRWTGGGNQTWDTGTSQNWYNLSTSGADYFYTGDNVLFNDAAGAGNANVTINGGTLGYVQPGTVTVSNTAVNYTFSGSPIGGGASLVKNGPGTLALNSSNTYTGNTTVNGGVLNDGAANSLGNGGLIVSGGTVNLNNPQSIASATVGGGLLNLFSAAALGSGPLNLSSGSLDNLSGSSLTFSGNPLNFNGNFTFVGSNPLNTGTGAVTLGTASTVTVKASPLTVGGNISGGYGLTTSGTGMTILAASNSYTGNTTIANGTLQVGASGAIPTGAGAGNVVFSNPAAAAVLDLNGNDTTVNGLSQPSPSTTNMVVNNLSGMNTLSIGNNNVSSTFAGVLADNTGSGGALALKKIGTGVLTLAGSNNTYSGATTINGGTLALAAGGNLPTAATVTFTGNATLAIGTNSPALASLSVSPSFTGVITGGGVLTLGTSSFVLGTEAATGNTVLDMSGLNGFVYNGDGTPGNVFQVTSGLNGTSAATPAFTSLLKLANSSSISTTSFIVGGAGPANFAAIAADEVDMGQSTVISANNFKVGYNRNDGTLKFASGVTNGSLTIYGSDPSTPLSNLLIGEINAGGQVATRVSTMDTTAGTLDALVDNMIVADNDRNNGNDTPNNALFLMGAGTLNATSITIAQDQPAATGGWACAGTASFNGSVVKVNTLTLANRQGGLTLSAQVTLDGGSTLYAGLIQSGGGTATRNFNWNDGTIRNYDPNTSLTIGAGPTWTLAATGSHTFAADAGQSVTVNAALGGLGSLTAAGPSLVVLAAGNTYSGPTNITGGTLQIGNGGSGAANGSLATSSTIAIANNGTLAFNRGDAVLQGTDFSGSPIVGMGGLVQMGPGALVLGANSYTGSTTVAGGSLYLNGAGATSGIAVNGGTLGGTASLTSITPVVGPSGAVEGGYNGTGTLTLGGLTFVGGGAVGENNLGVFPSSGTAAPINVVGTLTTDTTPVSVVIGGTLPVTGGTAHVIKYGTLAGSGYNFTLVPPTNAPRDTFNLVNVPGYVNLVYTIDYPYWAGAGDGTWNLSSTGNWNLNSNNTATTFMANDTVVFDDRAITYSGSAAQVVTIDQGDVSPSAVIFSNTAANYTLQSVNGGIAGAASVTFKGGGAVTIAEANSYTGGTVLSSGSVSLAAVQAIGTGPLTVSGGTLNANSAQYPSSVAISGGLVNLADPGALGSGTLTLSGGTLDNTSGAVMTLSGNNPQVWNGSFAFLGSNPLSLGTGTVSMNASSTVTVAAGTLAVGGAISDGGSGYALTLAGSGLLALMAQQNSYTGGTIVDGGTLATLAGNNPRGALGGGNVTVNNGGTIVVGGNNSFVGTATSGTKQIQINAGGAVTNVNGSTQHLNALVLNGGTLAATSANATFGNWNFDYGVSTPGNGTTSYITGGNAALSQTGGTSFDVGAGDTLIVSAALAHVTSLALLDSGIVKTGAGVLVLSGTNSYQGGTVVNGGTLIATNSQAILDGNSLSVGDPALLGRFAAVVPAESVPAAAPAAVPVPEPGTLALLAVGLCGAVVYRRWRKANS